MELSKSKIANSVTNLFRRCVIVRFGISKWDGKKSCDREKNKITSADGFLMKANLFVNDANFKAITRVDSDARSFVNKHTNYWGHGQRLLTMNKFDSFMSEMNSLEEKFSRTVDMFLDPHNYVASIHASMDYWRRHSKGEWVDMITEDDYPNSVGLRDRFYFRNDILQVPDGDFKVTVADEVLRDIQAKQNKVLEDQLYDSMTRFCDKIKDALSKASERFEDLDSPKITKTDVKYHKDFNSTIITNITDLCDTGHDLNIIDDPRITELLNDTRKAVSNFDAQQLKEDDHSRRAVKKNIDDVLNKFNL
tara:strand:- start:3275 stop:4195 length:921 start_codon:yes stop_codon:yes gene_type:complete